MAKVLEYGFSDASISLIADTSGNGADLDSNVPSTALAFAGTSPHKRVDCSVSNSTAHLARYLADSGDPVRTALEGAQKLRLIWRGRWGTVPDFRNVFSINNYTALYGDSYIGLAHEGNELVFKFNTNYYVYMTMARPTDGATVDHTYEVRLDTTLDGSAGNERLKFLIDDVEVNADSTGIALNETLSLPAGMQIALFGLESDNFGWRAFSANVGTAYLGLWVGETEGAYSEPDKHTELVADDDTFGSAPDTTAPIISALVTAPTSGTVVDASFSTDEPGTGYFLVSSNATETQPTIEAAANSAAATGGSCAITGLTWSAGQYLHAVQDDAAGNWSNVLNVLITDAQAPVATGPLDYIDVTYTGGRMSWVGATDNVAVTVWRRRIDGGSWTEFGGSGTTYFDFSGETNGASVLVEVQAGDGAGNWSNTLSKTITIGTATITVSYLRFSWGNVQRLKQIAPPPLTACTVIWMERQRSGSAMNTYMGGIIISRADDDFAGGFDCVMPVTQEHSTGGFDTTTGQRSPDSVGTSTGLFFHEVAGLASGAGGVDEYASEAAQVQPGETQASYPVVFDVMVKRVLRTSTSGGITIVEDYADWDAKKVIRQAWDSSAGITGAALATNIGTVPWATEYYNADVRHIRIGAERWDDATVDAAFASFDDTDSFPSLHFSNVSPTLDGTSVRDLRTIGAEPDAAHDFAQNGGVLPTVLTEEVEVPSSDATATGATVTAAASLVPGSSSGVASPTADGQTITATASLVPGSATGIINETASGALLAAAASLVDGSADGVQSPTADGQTLVADASILSGSADGTQSPTAGGATLTAAASIIPGSADAGTSDIAAGATVSATSSMVSGSATGEVFSTADGATISAAASLVAGAASGVRNPTADGQTLAAASSLLPGSADAGTADTALGATLTASASMVDGAATGVRNGTATGQVLTANATLAAGSAAGQIYATAGGQTLSVAASLIPGGADAGVDGDAGGATLAAAASLSAGSASGVQSPTAIGQTIAASAGLLPGAAIAVRNPTQAGAVLSASASIIAGSAGVTLDGDAAAVLLAGGSSILPGLADGDRNSVATGKVLDAFGTLAPGSADGQRIGTAVGALLEAILTLHPGSAVFRSKNPSLYRVEVPFGSYVVETPPGVYSVEVPAGSIHD